MIFSNHPFPTSWNLFLKSARKFVVDSGRTGLLDAGEVPLWPGCENACPVSFLSSHESSRARPKVDSPTEVRHTLFRLHHRASEQQQASTVIGNYMKVSYSFIFNFLLRTHNGEFLDCMTFVLE